MDLSIRIKNYKTCGRKHRNNLSGLRLSKDFLRLDPKDMNYRRKRKKLDFLKKKIRLPKKKDTWMANKHEKMFKSLFSSEINIKTTMRFFTPTKMAKT